MSLRIHGQVRGNSWLEHMLAIIGRRTPLCKTSIAIDFHSHYEINNELKNCNCQVVPCACAVDRPASKAELWLCWWGIRVSNHASDAPRSFNLTHDSATRFLGNSEDVRSMWKPRHRYITPVNVLPVWRRTGTRYAPAVPLAPRTSCNDALRSR